MSRLTRRSFLAASSVLGGSLAVPTFLRRALGAETAGGPKRFMMLFMPNCTIRDRWASMGGRNAESNTGDAAAYTLGALTKPLMPIMPYTTLIHGINMDAVDGDQHSSAQIRVTTGKGVIMPNINGGPGNLATGTSLDTFVAEQSSVVGASSTPFKRLVVSCDTRSPSLHHRCISTDMTSAFIAPDNDPSVVFARLFTSETLGMAGMSSQDRTMALQSARARKKSVLDFMASDLDRLQKRAPASQKMQLDSHLTAISALEKTLMAESSAPATTSGPAKPPTAPMGLKPNNSADHPKIVQAFFDIIRTSFQLDLTRVASFAFGTGNNAVSFADFGGGPSGGVHNISHQSKNTGTEDSLSTITLWYNARVAEFVQSLAAIPEGNGTMLDNTLILFFSEVGQWHEHNGIPLALIGGKNLGNAGNRVLTYNRQVNDVGMSILQQFQVPAQSFGDAKWFKGPAPGLLG